MQDTQKIVGIFLLIAFVLVTGSVVCLAAGQPSAMTDCGNQMNGVAMCPFMTAGLPTTVAASFGKEISIILILALVFVAVAAVIEIDRREATTLSRYWRSPDRPPTSFLNSTLRLISQGVLHSRVFGF